MYQLVKTDFQIYGWMPLLFFFLYPLAIWINSELFLYYLLFWYHGLFALYVFYNASANHVNQFYVSLPMSKKHVIVSKYIFLFSNAVIIAIYQWGMTIAMQSYVTNHTFLALKVILSSLAVSLVLLLLLLHIYYRFPAFVYRFTILVIPVCHLTGVLFESNIASIIPSLQGALLFVGIVLIIFVLSSLYTMRIYDNKDVI
ncbi:ABC-2 transporter permease [Aquibacillus koreensis]|uniref:ABC-2 transporter permease n=1 Tax=Aquibacillus koreensis TaxID=279446 RepID=A0A9X4AIV4_9BACI|nr:ABC-2 transporter permease [Aquibacillus koreensis]MCT2534666.1 ABC-2 transporter permease [Aquibacillus koreensis]MDC3419723.1 ABC-2 transporter permease [Aquibacillus koreensis]